MLNTILGELFETRAPKIGEPSRDTEIKTDSNSPQLFAFGIILLVLLFYFLYLQLRRLKYKKIARELRAEYKSQGPFRSGEIIGSSNGRNYSILTREVPGYKNSTTWTTLSVDCVNREIPLRIERGFFKTFPNWKYAFTLGDRTAKVFGADIQMQNAPVLLQECYRPAVQNLLQEAALLHGDLLRKGNIQIRQDQLSFSFRGVLKGASQAKDMIAAIETIASRVQSTPIAAVDS